jgi:hypothetical protein
MASQLPVFKKLGLKEDHRAAIINAPSGFKSPTKTIANPRLSGEFDLILFFAFDSSDLHKKLPSLKKIIKRDGRIWVAWQKGKVTDLDRDGIWKIGEGIGLDSVASCSLDDRWSAMKMMFPKAQRSL